MTEDLLSSSVGGVDVTETSTYSNVTTDRVVFGFLDVLGSQRCRSIWIYGAPPIVILGTIGNILSAVVMNRKSLRASTTSLYLTVLAVSDLFCLYIGLVPLWVQFTFSYWIGNMPNIGCTTYWSVLYFAFHFEAWVLVSVSLERFVAVWFPTRHKFLFTKSRAIIGLLILSIVFLGETLHFHFTYDTVDCHLIKKYIQFTKYVYPWIEMALASLLPFAIMAMTSFAIILKLMKNRKALETTKISSMTGILITVNIAFFLTTVPICIYVIALRIMLANGLVSEDTFFLFVELWAWVNLVLYVNNASNFVLYCVTGRRFRAELLKLLRMDRRVQPSANIGHDSSDIERTT